MKLNNDSSALKRIPFLLAAVLLCRFSVTAFAATNSTTVGNITWDFNNTVSFGGNGTAKWTNNADMAKFDKSGAGNLVNISDASGQVGCAGVIFGNQAGNWIFTNQLLQIGAGGVAQTLYAASTGLIFSNNVQMTASQTWSINAARPIKMLGNLSGPGPLTLDALGYLGNYTFAGADTFTGNIILTNGAMLTLDYATMGQNNAKLDPSSSLYLSPGLIALSGSTGSYSESVSSTFLTGGGSSVRKSGAGTETLALGPLTRATFSTYFQGADSLASTTSTNDATGILGCWAVDNAGWAATNGLGAIVANFATASWDASAWTNGLLNANANNASGVSNILGSLLLHSLRFGGTTFLDLSNNVLTLAGGGLMSVNNNPTLTNGYLQTALPSGELFIATVNSANLTNYATIQDNATNVAPTALVKFGDNTLVLAGSNSYSGGTYVNGGTIQVNAVGNLGGGKLFVGNYLTASPGSVVASVLFNNSGTVNLTNSLAGSGTIGNINGSGTVNLAITNSSSTITLTNGAGTLHLVAQGNNTVGLLKNGTGNLNLDGTASDTANVVSPSSSISCASGGSILVNGGNWIQPNIDYAPGAGAVLTVSGGTFTVYGGNGFNGSSVTINGGAFQTLNSGSRFSFNTEGQTLTINGGSMLVSNTIGLRLGNQNGTASATGNAADFTGVQTNGTLFVIGGGSVGLDMGGSANAGKTVSYTLSGGTVNVASGGWLNIGADTNGGTPTTFTMTGGKLRVSGPIQGGQSTNIARQVFAFNGGTVAARTIDARFLRNVDGGAIGTLVNTNGTLSPGDANTAGLTTILGNYSSSNNAVLAIDIGGANYPTAFTNGAGYYDSVAVTTNVVIGGSLNVSLINGFVPANTQSFLILASTNAAVANVTGTVSGTFNNLLSGNRVAVGGNTNITFDVVVSSPWVILTNYQSGASSPNIAPTNVVASIQNILGTNSIVITGSGGGGSSGYTVLTATNLTLPLASWTTNSTGIPFSSGGAVGFTNAINPASPQLFYRIRVP